MGRPKGRALLVYAPYGDFTYPYHSLAYVASPLLQAGYEADVIDLNAVWFRTVFTSERIRAWRADLSREFASLGRQHRLNVPDQERVLDLLRAVAICDRLRPELAVDILRSEAFYDWDQYLDARTAVRSFEALLDVVYAPLVFSSAFSIPPHEADAMRLVQKAQRCDRLIVDLMDLLEEHCCQQEYLFCGVSIPFSAHLAPAVALLEAVGRTFPGLVRVAGGTAIADVYKYHRAPSALAAFGRVCELLYVGEAETGVCALADWCRDPDLGLPPQAINLAAYDRATTRLRPYVALSEKDERRQFATFDWRNHPPRFEWVDWSLYLAPEKRVNYSPSRGCFWNKCAFCDYGLNENGPTAPARNMDAEVVVEHLATFSETGIRHVYFAVDALAPAFLRDVAARIIQAGVKIEWGCQLFLTKSFTPELVALLEASGLRLASFGLESGASRVLERMGKGRNRVETVLEPALHAFRQSRIGLQAQFFFGFPGETDADRQATVDFVMRHDDVFSPVTRGGLFTLLPGSIVAKNPGQYGVKNLRPPGDGDIDWVLDFELQDGAPVADCHVARRYNSQIPHCAAFERPWVGGTDTLHSQLYVERFGREVFPALRKRVVEREDGWVETSVLSAFDLERVFENAIINRSIRMVAPRPNGLLGERPMSDALWEILVPIERMRTGLLYKLKVRSYQEH